MISTRTKDKLQRTIDKRDNFYVNRSKNFSIDKGEKYIRESELSGITLLALVVTIIVLLILAGVTISAINSNNGVLTQAKKATITSDLSKYKEEVELYKASKQMEGTEKKIADGKRFEATSLNANYQEKSLVYNTQDGNETGDITTIIPDLKKDYHDGKRDNGEISVTNGQMVFKSTNDELYKIAQDLGIEVDPYNVKIEKDSNGKDVAVLTSSNKNLLLMSEDGTVTLPYDIEVIDKGTFSGVKGLKKIIIPYTVKEIRDNAFSNNNDIEEVEFQTKDGQGCTKIGWQAFIGCKKLKSVKLPDTLKSIESYSFANTSSLKICELPDSLEAIGECCFRFGGLETARIPPKVTFLGQMTFECMNLKSLTLSEGLERTRGSVFYGLTQEEIKLPTTLKKTDSELFYGVNNLKRVDITGNNYLEVKDDNYIVEKDDNSLIYINGDYLQGLTSFQIPTFITYFKYPELTFFNKIKKIEIPENTEVINIDGWRNINDISVSPKNNFFEVNGKMLCNKSEKLIYCFDKESKTIEIPAGIKTIGSLALADIDPENVTFAEDTEKLEAIVMGWIGNQQNLKSVTFGEKVKDINPIFCGDKIGFNVYVSNNNPYFSADGETLYNKNKDKIVRVCALRTGKITIPGNIKSIGVSAYYGQNKITEINIDGNSLETIEITAFYNCSQLTKINIPSSVTYISGNAFNGCTNLDNIIMPHSKEKTSKNLVNESPWGATKGDRAVKWGNQ